MVKEFEDAVFSQKKDEISEPVKTAYGYHIIQVTGITEAKQYTLDEVKAEITTTLLNDAKSRAWQTWVKAQKEKVGVVYAQAWVTTTTTTAAPTVTTSPRRHRHNGGSVQRHHRGPVVRYDGGPRDDHYRGRAPHHCGHDRHDRQAVTARHGAGGGRVRRATRLSERQTAGERSPAVSSC